MCVGNNASLIHVQSGKFKSCFYSFQTLITRKRLSCSGVTEVSESVKSTTAYSCLLSEEAERSNWSFSQFNIDDKRPRNYVNLKRHYNRIIIENEFWNQLQGKNKFISALAGSVAQSELSWCRGLNTPSVHISGRINFRLVLVWSMDHMAIRSKGALGAFLECIFQLYFIQKKCSLHALKPLCTVSQTAARTGWLSLLSKSIPDPN